MEKQQYLSKSLPFTPAPPRPRRHGAVILIVVAIVYTLSRYAWPLSFRRYVTSHTDAPFNWDTAPTGRKLEYADCYPEMGNFSCARLELPMDYFNGSTNATISLAVIRKPAAVPVTDSRYGGAVLLNPGGPGGSGVGLVLRGGKSISETLDDVDGGKYFDLISFDPRGVSDTLPRVQCSSDAIMAQSWLIRTMEEGIFGSSDAALGRLWSMSIAQGGSCSLPPADGQPDIKKFVSTASVARDMISLIEAHGEWREKEAESILCRSHEVPETLKYKPGKEKILYWGFSYGTYLGSTFAAMFPDRIHRLVVDGVVDAYDYRNTLWYDNLVDTEADMDLFYSNCARVGFPNCPLANQTGKTTAEGVKNRVENITMSLWHNPLPVIGDYPEIITYSDVKNLIFATLYSPIQGFPYLANLLSDIEQGDGSRFADLLRPYHDFYCPAQSVSTQALPLRNSSGSTDLMYDALMAIACTDGEDQSYVDRDRFEKHVKKLEKLSPSIGAMWATIRLGCIHYSIRALTRFEAPFVGETSHPLLFIGNTADPVTPLRNAFKMAKGYSDAGVLTQDSGGHCSMAAFSKCTTSYIREYFQTGNLPPTNTTCKADEVPFGLASGGDEVVETAELIESRQRVAGIRNAVYAVGGGFLGPVGSIKDLAM